MPALIAWWTQDVEPLAPAAEHHQLVDAGARLLARWTEPHRAYHSTHHLVELFWALEELEQAGEVSAQASRIARVAAWFHDAVYDPAAGDGANERASADLARTELTGLGIAPGVVEEVERLVLLTASHRPEPGDRPGRALCDADLWILASAPDRYAEYTQQVRREYHHVPHEAFRAGRRQVLEHLAAGNIYATGLARAQWEAPARANLARELAGLG